MDNFYKRFCKTGFDENGVLNYFEPIVPEGFNFAYDVMDAIAAMEPDKVAHGLVQRARRGKNHYLC